MNGGELWMAHGHANPVTSLGQPDRSPYLLPAPRIIRPTSIEAERDISVPATYLGPLVTETRQFFF